MDLWDSQEWVAERSAIYNTKENRFLKKNRAYGSLAVIYCGLGGKRECRCESRGGHGNRVVVAWLVVFVAVVVVVAVGDSRWLPRRSFGVVLDCRDVRDCP